MSRLPSAVGGSTGFWLGDVVGFGDGRGVGGRVVAPQVALDFPSERIGLGLSAFGPTLFGPTFGPVHRSGAARWRLAALTCYNAAGAAPAYRLYVADLTMA